MVGAPGRGSWRLVQDWSTTASSVAWNTTTETAGTSSWQVWVRGSGSTADYEAYAVSSYRLRSGSLCTAVTMSASPPSPQTLGTAVTWSATNVIGCATPEYKWWELPAGGSWRLVQDWSTTASSVAWNTTTETAGTSSWQVWVRGSGSTADYEAYAVSSYRLRSGSLCTAVTMSASPPSPQTLGTAVTWSATNVIGCATPEYKWWELPAGGAGDSFRTGARPQAASLGTPPPRPPARPPGRSGCVAADRPPTMRHTPSPVTG